jgi:zinc transport system substrate-binding protein
LNVSKGVETICEDENREHNHVHEENNNIENEHMEDVHSEEDDEHDDSHNENVILGSDEHAGHDHSHSADPHIWTSPVNAIQMVKNIEEALVKIDGKNAEFYKENAHEYIHALEALDSKFREVVSNSDSKTIYFGGRFAMSYFAHEYDLNYVAAFDSCQAKSEPSAKLIVKIIDMMRQNNVRIVLHEEMTDPKAARIIAEEIEGEALLLHSCHNVSKAEMESGVTYLSLMEQNVANLQRALNK